MIAKPRANKRNLKILLGATLAIAAILTLILLFVPEKEGCSAEQPGVLLYPDGESASCTVRLQGDVLTYAFSKDEPIFKGSLQTDGQEVCDLRLTFDGKYYVAGEADAAAVMSNEMEIAALVRQDGKDCLLLAPAADGSLAQALLSRFLSASFYARQQGWEAFQQK